MRPAKNRRFGRWPGRLAVGLLAMFASAISVAAQSPPRSVLVLDQSDPGRGGPISLAAALRDTLNKSGSHVSLYGETFDLGRFAEPRQEEILRNYLQEKYRDIRFGAVVTVGSLALKLVRNWRDELWPGVPVVFAGVDETSSTTSNPPTNVTGIIMRRRFSSMVDAARVLVPDLNEIALVGDRLETDAYRRQYLLELPALMANLKFIDLTGLPIDDVTRRVGNLEKNSAILYTSIFVDGRGVTYLPKDALEVVAKAANRPIVTDVDTLMGYGAAGGYVINNIDYGQEAARLVLRILDGESASAIPVAVGPFIKPVFDWRELQRWNVAEKRLPLGSEIRFQPPGIWDQYRTQVLIAVAIVLFQSALIMWLIIEHRRRATAELEVRRRLAQVELMNRSAGVGALSAAFAHDLNQPLTAIRSNAEAAKILLGREKPDLGLVEESLADILRSDQHAAEIIAHMRDLLRTHEVEGQVVDLNEAVNLASEIVTAEARARSVTLNTELAPAPLRVRADPVHLQQVILNLVLNGMDAMSDSAPNNRKMTIRTSVVNGSTVKVSISDSGPGIAAGTLQNIFEPFFTTKAKGLGLGLYIVRTIVERSGGKIWAENRAGGGAIFRISLPLAEELAA
jgi:signal transduction histidine kinase